MLECLNMNSLEIITLIKNQEIKHCKFYTHRGRRNKFLPHFILDL